MKLKPLADRILVKAAQAASVSAGGIIIPENSREKTQQGEVIEVGAGTEKNPITVTIGQKIMYDKYAGISVKIENEDYLILKISDVIAVVED